MNLYTFKKYSKLLDKHYNHRLTNLTIRNNTPTQRQETNSGKINVISNFQNKLFAPQPYRSSSHFDLRSNPKKQNVRDKERWKPRTRSIRQDNRAYKGTHPWIEPRAL